MKTIGKATTIILLLIASMIIYGFAIQKLWLWFIAPVFNLQPLTIFQAYGIFLFVSIFRIRYQKKKENETDEELWKYVLKGVSWILFDAGFVVVLAWLINTLFM